MIFIGKLIGFGPLMLNSYRQIEKIIVYKCWNFPFEIQADFLVI
jgi:hypothetical protein